MIAPVRRNVAHQSADARVSRRQSCAAGGFGQIVNFFALGECQQKNCDRADIHRECTETKQVRRDSRQFAAHDADVLAARRQFIVDTEGFFNRERVGDVVRQRREIIQTIRVRNELRVSHVLGDFFVAAMQITHVRVGLGDDLAVQFEQNSENAVRGRMRRPHVQHHLLADGILKLFRRLLRTRGGIRNLNVLNGGH